jgi:uncharacterized protein (DUF2237 family)
MLASLLLLSLAALLLAPPTSAAMSTSRTSATLAKAAARNVNGGPLALCSRDPVTGFFRTGYCETDAQDRGVHVVAAVVNEAFLSYTRARGNDLSTPHPPHFPGLKPGDRWCLCALRWLEAAEAGVAPPVDLEATNEAALRYIPLEILQRHDVRRAVGADAAPGAGEPPREAGVGPQ